MQRSLVVLVGASLTLGALAVPAGAQEAPAAAFTVDTAVDARDAAPGDGVCDTGSGVCSLRAAVDEANAVGAAGGGPVTITIADGVDPVLSLPGVGEYANAAGDLDTRADITIRGAGTIDAGGIDRVIDHHAGTLTIDGLTITGGLLPTLGYRRETVYGGGIYARGPLHLVDANVTGNVISGTWEVPGPGAGAGVALDNVTATITGSRITDNLTGSSSPISYFEGAGLYAWGTDLRITDTVVDGNTALLGTGGGIHVNDSTVVAERVSVRANTADGLGSSYVTQGGGGWYVVFSDVTIADSTIAGNGAWPTDGGGIAGAASTLTISGSTVEGNEVWSGDDGSSGGGVALRDTDLTVEASTLSGNIARFGGGLSVGSGSTASIDRSTISGNTATEGAAAVQGPVDLTAATVAANRGPSSFAGGVLSTRGSVLSAGDNVLCATAATSGGHNVASDSSCGLTGTGDRQGVNPLLAPLGANGGPTATHRLRRGSPAIDAIPVGIAGLCDASSPIDQRGERRPGGPGCDAGSFERRK